MIASVYGKHLSLAELLKKYGASPAQKQLDETLVTMVARGWVPGVHFLLDHGANVNAKNSRDEPGLYTAISRKNSGVAIFLLQHRADAVWSIPKYRHLISAGALQFASYQGLDTVVRVLLDRGENSNFDGEKALQAASSQGHLSIVKYLLENGGDSNACEKNNTAFYAACRCGHISIVEHTLENGANVNVRNGNHDTVLQVACEGASFEIVKLLLDRGVEISVAGGTRESAMHAAVAPKACGNLDRQLQLLKMLLEAGAHIHEKPGKNETLCSLAVSAYSLSPKVLELLIERGADVNAKNTEGLCALVVASRKRSVGNISMLIEAGAGYDINHGVDYDVWNQAIVEAQRYSIDEFRDLILRLLRSGLRKAEERWADQQRKNQKPCIGQSWEQSDA